MGKLFSEQMRSPYVDSYSSRRAVRYVSILHDLKGCCLPILPLTHLWQLIILVLQSLSQLPHLIDTSPHPPLRLDLLFHAIEP